jgi:DNA-binding transcriptional ArsR family regulator
MATIQVRDHLSNSPEHIEELARALGKGQRLAVFKAIYRGKKRVKTVSELMKATQLSHVRVLQLAGELADREFVEQEKVDGETAYRTIRFFQVNKRKVLRFNGNTKALEKVATKRRVKLTIRLPRSVTLPTKGANVARITVDDVDTFAAVRDVPHGESLPKSVSEDDFKSGVQAVVGQAGQFRDWPGENADLYTSRMMIGGKRVTAAFAFKGPGQPGKLTPGRMGKNGDQAQRMFQLDADVFIAQHWREIEPSVVETMRTYAVAKSIATGKRILYGVIDGQDSERLRQAYPKKFGL